MEINQGIIEENVIKEMENDISDDSLNDIEEIINAISDSLIKISNDLTIKEDEETFSEFVDSFRNALTIYYAFNEQKDLTKKKVLFVESQDLIKKYFDGVKKLNDLLNNISFVASEDTNEKILKLKTTVANFTDQFNNMMEDFKNEIKHTMSENVKEEKIVINRHDVDDENKELKSANLNIKQKEDIYLITNKSLNVKGFVYGSNLTKEDLNKAILKHNPENEEIRVFRLQELPTKIETISITTIA